MHWTGKETKKGTEKETDRGTENASEILFWRCAGAEILIGTGTGTGRVTGNGTAPEIWSASIRGTVIDSCCTRSPGR